MATSRWHTATSLVCGAALITLLGQTVLQIRIQLHQPRSAMAPRD
jgi:hypothetical protein